MVTRERVLQFFERTRKPLPFRDVAAQMELGRAQARSLKRVLRELVRQGELVRTHRGLYGPVAKMELVKGYFEAHAEGYGFVILERPGERDIFIPARATRSAMDNDRVVAQVEDPWRRSGRIVRVLERAHAKVVGTVELSRRACFVRPKSRAVPFEIFVPLSECRGARSGERVLVEITRYPERREPAVGRVLKALPEPEDPFAETESIMEEFGLPKSFPREVQAEARALRQKPLGRRRSLLSLSTVTIDGETARDFDDAVSVAGDAKGFTLWVHIADVGFYVGWDSPLDMEARRRATSVYFPDRVIPMLPKALSEDLCSLRPGEPRPAVTVEMRFDPAGVRQEADFYVSLIRSDARMTYTSVRKIIVDRDPGERQAYGALVEDLDRMGDLARLLRRRRLGRGSLDFDLPEPEVLLDLQGRPEAIVRAERNFAHMLIEEFMIAANETVAENLRDRGVPSLYRIHEEPDPRKVEDVVRFARGRRGGRSARELHRLLRDVQGTSREEVVTYLVLRAMKQARYSPDNVGHFGLASECYTHFTSPIRRYPDLVVHRVLRELLTRKRLPAGRAEALAGRLPDIAFHSSRLERLAEEAEREVVDAMRMWYMKDRVGEEFDARVVGLGASGIRVRLQDVYVEGGVPMGTLTDDFYAFDDRSITLRGRHSGRTFSLGQQLRVRVDRVDREERQVVFGLARDRSGQPGLSAR